MRDIVVIYNDEPRASSQLIAVGFNRKHKVVLRFIEKYKSDLEEFGNLPLEKVKSLKKIDLLGVLKTPNSTVKQNKARQKAVGPKAIKTKGLISPLGRPVDAYLLNEEQTTFLVTLFANSKIVVEFKKTLVKEFYKQRRLLLQVIANRHDSEWVRKRIEGKKRRVEATDKIKDFIVYAKEQGSKNADWYYNAFTSMQNKALFCIEGKFKNLRDVMLPEQLMVIGVADGIVKKTITGGIKKGLFYKDIFKEAKENMLLFAQLHGQEKIIAEVKQLQPPE